MFGNKVFVGVSLSIVSALCLTALMLAAPADTPVADAAMNGDMDALRSLLRTGTDVNAAQNDGMTALHWASLQERRGDGPDADLRGCERAGGDPHQRDDSVDRGGT